MKFLNPTTIIIFLFSFYILSCNEEYMGGGYYYLPEYEAVDIGYPYG